MSAPQTDPSLCFVPTDTIIDTGRVARCPLTEWSRQLLLAIEASLKTVPTLAAIRQGCGALNNAALLIAHAGLPEAAESICHSQLLWLDMLCDRFSRIELSTLAIDPWVNLGRLRRRSRDYGRALDVFRALQPTATGASLRLGKLEVQVSECFRQTAEPIYVYEMLRTYLQAGDLESALRFADELVQPLQTGSVMLKTELVIQVFLRYNEPTRALPLLKEMPWPKDRFGVMAQSFYTAVALHATGRGAACEKVLAWQGPHICSHLRRRDVTTRDLRFGIEVCRLALHANQHDLFADVLAAGCCAVLRLCDVPMAAQLMLLATRHHSSAMIRELGDVECLVMQSGYRSFTPQRMTSETADSVAALEEAISQLVCCSASAVCA